MNVLLSVVRWIAVCALAAAALYVFLLFPRPGAKRKFSPFLQRMYAHRGIFDNRTVPENSLPAFQLACKRGMGVELDIHRTLDGEVVVFHDDSLMRMCGVAGSPEEWTLAALKTLRLLHTKETIPTLKEVLERIDGRVPLLVELKGRSADVSLSDAAMPILENYRGLYAVQSFHPLLLRRYARLAPHVMRGILVTDFRRDGEGDGFVFRVLESLLPNVLTRPDFISTRYTDGKRLPLRLCRKFGAALFAWTICERKEYDMASAYFDAFICENPENLLR